MKNIKNNKQNHPTRLRYCPFTSGILSDLRSILGSPRDQRVLGRDGSLAWMGLHGLAGWVSPGQGWAHDMNDAGWALNRPWAWMGLDGSSG